MATEDALKKQKDLEKTPLEEALDREPTGKEAAVVEEEEGVLDEELSSHELLVQLSKNIVVLMKAVTKVGKNVEDFRSAWSRNQKAGRF